MSAYQNLIREAQTGKPILIDGATGTEVEHRGVPQLQHAWNGGAALSHPEIVQSVHEDYIRCGARVIISNTFATHANALEDAGVDHNFEAYNRRGVEIACAARDSLDAREVLVAGGISYWSWSGNKPPIPRLRSKAIEQASIMKDAGADFLMLEMMIDVDRMMAVLEAACSTGLPVWVGYTCKVADDGSIVLRNGEPLEEAIAAMNSYKVDVVNIMHTDVAIITQCLDGLAKVYTGLTGVYAHSGTAENHAWDFDGVIAPAGYQRYVDDWVKQDINFVGGCCGIGVEHMKLLSRSAVVA